MPLPDEREILFNINKDDFVILYTGRLSKEKGVLELPAIYRYLISKHSELKMVIAGTGPAEAELKQQLPEAIYLGWVEHNKLPEIYSASDMLILPSKFDTFSCSVLESISCGLPVIAYNIKGPKDIIQDQENGFLVNTLDEMKTKLSHYIGNRMLKNSYKEKALQRAHHYKKDLILNKLLSVVGLQTTNNE